MFPRVIGSPGKPPSERRPQPRPGAILGAVYVGANLHRLALRPSCADPRSPHLRDREPHHAQRPTAGLHHARRRHGDPGAHQGGR
jgi:hypothetical protein